MKEMHVTASTVRTPSANDVACTVNCLVAALKVVGSEAEKQLHIEQALMALVGMKEFERLRMLHLWLPS
jgi:hypothetical protein